MESRRGPRPAVEGTAWKGPKTGRTLVACAHPASRGRAGVKHRCHDQRRWAIGDRRCRRAGRLCRYREFLEIFPFKTSARCVVCYHRVPSSRRQGSFCCARGSEARLERPERPIATFGRHHNRPTSGPSRVRRRLVGARRRHHAGSVERAWVTPMDFSATGVARFSRRLRHPPTHTRCWSGRMGRAR